MLGGAGHAYFMTFGVEADPGVQRVALPHAWLPDAIGHAPVQLFPRIPLATSFWNSPRKSFWEQNQLATHKDGPSQGKYNLEILTS